ncbi:hypothetical protein TWF696_001757 [Orbilia brochopaga]|uniref:HNH nuclease domain-containing protein n=1 Tax=Orbilia brochopaga TaxID=3140254 RepID=A0AAV9U8U9_9PEZI
MADPSRALLAARHKAHNVIFVVPSASAPPSEVVIGGIFQPDTAQITYARIIEDIRIVYPDTTYAIKHSEESLELAFYETDAKGHVTIFHENEIYDTYPKVPKGETTRRIGVILHRKAECTQIGSQRKSRLKRQPSARWTIQAHIADSGPPTPTASTKKRKLATPKSFHAIASPDSIVRGDAQSENFESKVKATYNICALSGDESQFGELHCGPGFEAAQIVPRKFWFAYPLAPAASGPGLTGSDAPPLSSYSIELLRNQYFRIWQSANGLLLRADLRAAFDARLIAIHPVDLRIRVFAPMKAYLGLHGMKAHIPKDADIDRKALRWHWRQSVIENFAAHPFTNKQAPRTSCYRKLLDKLQALTTDSVPVAPFEGNVNFL